MTREEVKNAGSKHAQDMYCSGDNPTPRYRIAQIHASRDGFVAGAEWRINSVWHEASETPNKEKELLILDHNNRPWVISPGHIWEHTVEIFCVKKWAYIKDLLPIKED